MAEPTLRAEHLNGEPPILKGCTQSELTMIAGAAVAGWLPVSLIAAVIFGNFKFAMALALIGTLITVAVMVRVFQKIKRHRPDGYYQQMLRIQAARFGLVRNPFVRRTGLWDIGRTWR
jgi:conjugative transfer region protein (TIGR03750 family)